MNEHYPFVNPPLPYAYDALEPYIGKQTLYLHHDKILQRYFMNLNNILSIYPDLQTMSLEELLSNAEDLPPEIRQSVINNASVIYNHLIYFNGMSSPSERYQTTYLNPAIIRNFGSVEQFFNEIKRNALSLFGVGYVWIVLDSNGDLQIITTPNDISLMADDLCILAVIDLWEHAYYLNRYNDRNAYIEDWFHVFSWEKADERFENCIKADNSPSSILAERF